MIKKNQVLFVDVNKVNSIYQTIAPHSLLSQHVDSIWIQEHTADFRAEETPPTTVLPTNRTDLAFYYGDAFEKFISGQRTTLPMCHLTGQRTKPLKLQATGNTGIVLVSLKPWGVYHFFNVPSDHFKNQLVDLKDVINTELVLQLQERLAEAETPDSRVKQVQDFLLTLLKDKEPDPVIMEAVNMINESNGKLAVSKVASHFYISKRQFIRRFQQVIGLNPIEFSNIIRFQKALYGIKEQFSVDELIELCGYYDQAHLISDFNRFGNTSPGKVADNFLSTDLKACFNSQHKMSHFYNTIYL